MAKNTLIEVKKDHKKALKNAKKRTQEINEKNALERVFVHPYYDVRIIKFKSINDHKGLTIDAAGYLVQKGGCMGWSNYAIFDDDMDPEALNKAIKKVQKLLSLISNMDYD